MQIGTLLRKLRDRKRLSTREIAIKIDVAHSTYMDWEHDKTSPSLKLFVRLAGALEVNPVELMAYLTGQVHDTMPSEEKSNISDLKELIKFYRRNNDLLEKEKTNVEEELAKVKEYMRHRHEFLL